MNNRPTKITKNEEIQYWMNKSREWEALAKRYFEERKALQEKIKCLSGKE